MKMKMTPCSEILEIREKEKPPLSNENFNYDLEKSIVEKNQEQERIIPESHVPQESDKDSDSSEREEVPEDFFQMRIARPSKRPRIMKIMTSKEMEVEICDFYFQTLSSPKQFCFFFVSEKS